MLVCLLAATSGFGASRSPASDVCESTLEQMVAMSCSQIMGHGWTCLDSWASKCPGRDNPFGAEFNTAMVRDNPNCAAQCTTPWTGEDSTTGHAGWFRHKVCESAGKMWEGEYCHGCGDGKNCAPIEDASCKRWRPSTAGVCRGPSSWVPGSGSSYIDCTEPDMKPRIYDYASYDCTGDRLHMDHKPFCWFGGGEQGPFDGLQYPIAQPYYDCPMMD